MNDLFSESYRRHESQSQPLAERMRPTTADQFTGQRRAFEFLSREQIPSLILWGPPGSGKTTFAHILSHKTKSHFVSRSAIDTGAKELKEEGETAKYRLFSQNQRTILFIDEIHRLNRAQQDCLLPYVEKGHVILIGATTENPSFEINKALLSRCQVIVFDALTHESIEEILDRAINELQISWAKLSEVELKNMIVSASMGDARRALNLLEYIYNKAQALERTLSHEEVKEAFSIVPIRYDKAQDSHYDTISAFIKSIRGSDPNAALYYLAVMLKGGEDPLFIARRLVILASEDVSNADPRALSVAVSVKEAVDFVGMPEAAINLAQGVTYLACAPKSNKSYMGLKKAYALVEENPHLDIPLSIRNAPTGLMKELGYGDNYSYAHDSDTGVTKQKFMPEKIAGTKLYEPSQHGYEKHIKQFLEWVEEQRK